MVICLPVRPNVPVWPICSSLKLLEHFALTFEVLFCAKYCWCVARMYDYPYLLLLWEAREMHRPRIPNNNLPRIPANLRKLTFPLFRPFQLLRPEQNQVIKLWWWLVWIIEIHFPWLADEFAK